MKFRYCLLLFYVNKTTSRKIPRTNSYYNKNKTNDDEDDKLYKITSKLDKLWSVQTESGRKKKQAESETFKCVA